MDRRDMLRLIAATGLTLPVGAGRALAQPAVTRTRLPAEPRWRGADLSFVPQLEAAGVTWSDARGTRDVVRIFADAGINLMRLRVWVNPVDGWSSVARTAAMASRARAAGMRTLIDFHYSDTWADPGHQTPPAAWSGLSLATMADRVYRHTRDALDEIVSTSGTPLAVQIGNEITNGMLWPVGQLYGSGAGGFANLGALLSSASSAVRDATAGRARSVVHLDRGGDSGACQWFFDNLLPHFSAFDTIGLSFYPWWHGTLSALSANVTNLTARYGRPVWVVETAYPFTLGWNDNEFNIVGQGVTLEPGYSPTSLGQSGFINALISAVASAPVVRDSCVCYWAPEWVSMPPQSTSPWENLALFSFTRSALPALATLGRPRAFSAR
ncbi:MAG: glycosyl hydrolase 53 family protein [Planctomycetota bacterium]|nr:glycosyl hydrolase 53 family protein [Planctomycetota bacterium]